MDFLVKLSEVIYHYLPKVTPGVRIYYYIHRLELQTKVYSAYFIFIHANKARLMDLTVIAVPSKELIVIKCRSSEYILPKCT